MAVVTKFIVPIASVCNSLLGNLVVASLYIGPNKALTDKEQVCTAVASLAARRRSEDTRSLIDRSRHTKNDATRNGEVPRPLTDAEVRSYR